MLQTTIDRRILNRLILAALCLALLLPAMSYAMDITVDSHTYYDLHEDEQGITARDIGTLYEYLSLNVDGEELSFVFTGWGRTETLDEKIGFELDENEAGDFSAAYIEYSKDYANFRIRLGRQTVLGLKSYESVDGISLRTDLPLNFAVSGFAGIPEENEEFSSEDDFLSGGRVTFGFANSLELAAGYLEKKDFDVTTRRETFMSVWLKPFSKLELYGESVTNKLTDKNAYTGGEAVIYLTENITLAGNYEKIDYMHYYSDSEVAIFNLVNPNDEIEITGGSIDFSITDNLSVRIDSKDYTYKIAKLDGGTSYGAEVKLATDATRSAISYHKTDCDDVTKGYYDEYRAYFMTTPEDGLAMSIDAIFDSFEKKTNNSDSSLSVIASAGYIFDEDLRVSADVSYIEDAQYEEDVRVFARVEYSFGTSIDMSSDEEEEVAKEEEPVKEEEAPEPVKEEEKQTPEPEPEPEPAKEEVKKEEALKAEEPVKEEEFKRPYTVIDAEDAAGAE